MTASGIISLVFSGLMLVTSIVTFVMNGVRNTKENSVHNEKQFSTIREDLLGVRLKLEEVSSTVNETRTDIKVLNSSFAELDKRMAVVERDVKTAFDRIDELRRTKADKEA